MIVCGFPGVGKSYLSRILGASFKSHMVADSDSSQFSWIEGPDGVKGRNPRFAEDYLNHIKKLMSEGKSLIMVSTHKEIRDALVNEKIPHYIAIPSRDRKDEFEKIYQKRGNDFGEFIIHNWDSILDDIMSYVDNGVTQIIEMKSGFLSDFIFIDSAMEVSVKRCIDLYIGGVRSHSLMSIPNKRELQRMVESYLADVFSYSFCRKVGSIALRDGFVTSIENGNKSVLEYDGDPLSVRDIEEIKSKVSFLNSLIKSLDT